MRQATSRTLRLNGVNWEISTGRLKLDRSPAKYSRNCASTRSTALGSFFSRARLSKRCKNSLSCRPNSRAQSPRSFTAAKRGPKGELISPHWINVASSANHFLTRARECKSAVFVGPLSTVRKLFTTATSFFGFCVVIFLPPGRDAGDESPDRHWREHSLVSNSESARSQDNPDLGGSAGQSRPFV